MTLTFALPCRTDEPAVEATLTAIQAAWALEQDRPPGVCVCVNGPGRDVTPVECTLAAWAARNGWPCDTLDLDARDAAILHPRLKLEGVLVLRTRRAGKAQAWNHLRRALAMPVVVWVDADVTFAADVPARLVQRLLDHPEATLASARTQARVRSGWLERVQAVPYAFPFENLSPQLYAARCARLPLAIPEDLLDPERWLELVVGSERIVHAPGAIVWVRLAATFRDFFRQRVRLEQARMQLAAEYPGLAGRGRPGPAAGRVGRHYAPADLARLAGYLLLRSAAAAVGAWRHRRGRVEVAWRQATSTKVSG